MYKKIKITEGVYHIGINDRVKERFENMWPLPSGVAYNSYVIVDEKCALIDTVDAYTADSYVERIEAILGGKELDYIVVNHVEPDHSSMLGDILRRWPAATVVGNGKTFSLLEGYMEKPSNTLEVKDGQELSLGAKTLRFVTIPWVHWPETMACYEKNDKILFSSDAFGSFGALDGGVFDDEIDFEGRYLSEMRRYYSNIVGKYSNMTQKALKKLADTEINYICPAHGPLWRENPAKVVALYDKWSRYEADDAVVIIYASMYGNTAQAAEYIAHKLKKEGVKDIAVYDVSKTDVSYLISEMWRCKGIILGSVSYNGDMHPMMKHLTSEIEHIGIKSRHWGLFGSYSWNGGGLRSLEAFAQRISIESICENYQMQGSPTLEKLSNFDKLAKAMAEKLEE